MKPLFLTLQGFRGIRDGLGRDSITLDLEALAGDAALVALKGANGRGKTTLLDNLTPFLVMPSRAGADGLGSFSYYDHVHLPESLKDLTWEHEGSRYRSQVVIRLNGRRRTEAFLLVQKDAGWEPLRLADGTVSDGKVETYNRCVTELLGSPETFFTSVFSAQGRRQLSSYKNAEIKALLTDLLGLDEIRVLGAKASETAKLIRAGLAARRAELARVSDDIAETQAALARLGDVEARIAAATKAHALAQNTCEQAREAVTRLSHQREGARQWALRRAELVSEQDEARHAGQVAGRRLDEEDRREVTRLQTLERRIAERQSAREAERLRRIERETRLQRTLALAASVRHAQRRLGLSQTVVTARETRLETVRTKAAQRQRWEAVCREQEERMAALERQAGQAALRAQEISRRLALSDTVPCVGTDLQGRCQLLVDALEAKRLMPSAERELRTLEEERRQAMTRKDEACRALQALGAPAEELTTAMRRLQQARQRAEAYGRIAARSDEMSEAAHELARIQADGQGEAGMATECRIAREEAAERQDIETARAQIAARRRVEANALQEKLAWIAQVLTQLPPAFDERLLAEAQARAGMAARHLEQVDAERLETIRSEQGAKEYAHRLQTLQSRRDLAQRQIAEIERALEVWALLVKALSHDGVIALAIDDAGPQLAALANDLLLACYGARFSLSIRTLVETAKGEAREGFDIVVHDADSGQSKSVADMSGGERVWINECLTRAIALYLAQQSGRRYETLFSDEADGPLDPERKRMFIAMKREVLRLGHYEREVFISQTPELAQLADASIDLDDMACNINKE